MSNGSDIFVGSVAVGIVPSAVGFPEKMRAAIVPSAGTIGKEWGGKFHDGTTANMSGLMSKWSEEQSAAAKTGGAKVGTSFSEAFKAKVKEVTDTLPPVELKANATEADTVVDELRARLESLSSKTIGIDISGTEATAELDKIKAQMVEIRDNPAMARVEASVQNWQPTLDKVAQLREMASKPIIQEVVVETKGVGGAGAGAAAEADLAKGMEKEMEVAGEASAGGFGSRFMGKLQGLIGAGSAGMASTREGMVEKMKSSGEEAGKEFGGAFSGILGAVTKVGVPAAVVGALLAVSAVMGEKLDTAQKQLQAAMSAGGASWDKYAGQVHATGQAMTEYGFTQDQVDSSIRTVFQATQNMGDALKAQGTIANIAASQHISLAAASTQYTRALNGNARALKTLGVQQATGTTEAKAVTLAQQMLSSSIQQAGGMAQFAALHHMSLAQAQKLSQQAASGSIPAFNKLGIEVIPKSASAAQNFAQVQAVLNARLGGQAQAVADTFGGKIANLRAKFVDAAESIGQKVLPFLEKLMDAIIKGIPVVERIVGAIAHFVQPAVSLFFNGLSVIWHALTTGPMKLLTVGILAVATAIGVMRLATLAFEAMTPFGWVLLAVTAIVILVGVINKFHTQILVVFKAILDTIRGWWNAAWSWVKEFYTAQLNAVRAITSSVLGWFRSAYNSVLGFIKGLWNTVWGQVKDIYNTQLNAVKSITSAVLGWFRSTYNSVLSFLKNLWNTVWGQIKDLYNGQLNTIKSITNAVVGWLRSTYNSVLGFLKNLWNTIWGQIKDTYNGILNTIKSVTSAALNWIKSTFGSALGWIRSTWSTAWNAVSSTVHNIFEAVKKTVGAAFAWIKSAFHNAVHDIGVIWSGIQEAAKKPVQFIVGTVYNKGIVPVVDAIAGIIGKHPLQPVAGFARGTSGAPPGWAWVGEEGPELVKMTGGETVLPHQQSMATGLWGAPGFATGTGTASPPIPGTPAAAAAAINQQQAVNAKRLASGNQTNPFGWLWGKAEAVPGLIKKVGSAALGALKSLAGDAIKAAINTIVNPLINAIPGTGTPIGGWIKQDIQKIESELVDWIGSNTAAKANPAVGGGSGSDVAAYAKQFAQGNKYPYRTGGASPGGWDCSGFSAYVYDHFGYFPGKQGQRFGTSETQFADKTNLQGGSAVPGALVFFDDHVYANPGHVGIVLNGSSYVSAYDTAEGTVIKSLSGNVGFREPKGGFKSAAPAGGATGSEMSNGIELYQYLKAHLFGGNKIAAAGAAASIWGESLWNPFAQGSGGRGLIGWTPPGTISDAAFKGGMATQLPAILAFVTSSGDSGVIAQMFRASSVLDAANLWGRGVERFGINDVHGQGLALATQIMNKYATGTKGAASGWGLVGEEGMELVKFNGGETVLSNAETMAALGGMPGASAYYQGTVGSAPGELVAASGASLKSALRDVERKLDNLTKATKGVGGDVASNLDSTSRGAGHRSAFNTTGHRRG